MSRSDAFAAWVLGHRSQVAIVLALLTLVALVGIFDPLRGVPRVRVDPSLNEMLPADDPSRRFYEELLQRFGSDDVVVVVLRSPELFTPVGLGRLSDATSALAGLDGVHHVEGLANALRIRPFEGDVEIAGFLEAMPSTRAEAEALQDDVLADPLRAGTFVSQDGQASAILVTFERMPEDEFLARGLDRLVLETARRTAPGMDVILAGTPHVKAEVGRLLTAELILMVPAVFALMSLLSCGFFRSVRLGMVPIAAVSLGLVWTVGVMGWVGHDLNIVTTLIPPLILALGFAYATHVVSRFQTPVNGEDRRGERAERTRVGRARAALAQVAFPVAFTALTTAAGFLSLASNGLAVIRGFGIFATVSVMTTLVAALTLVPLLLSIGRREGPRKTSPYDAIAIEETDPSAARRLDRFFGALARFNVRHSRAILALGAGVAFAAVWSATQIEVNLPVIENFGRDTEIRRAYAEVDRLFGGANQFYLMLRADEPGAFDRPEWLREVASLQAWLEDQPEIGRTISVVQYLEVLNEALGPENPPVRRIPDHERLVAQLLLFGGNEELDVLLDRAHQVITILVRSTATETREFDRLARRIDARLEDLPPGITGHTTGNAILLTRAADRISRGQAVSLVLACGMIGCLLVGYFRSLRLGLFALLPNVLPVLIYFGMLGLFGITLNNATALMGSIVLGIAVDDTLHLLVEYRRALRETRSPDRAIAIALSHVGRAISCTTIAICAGLLVVGASQLRNQAEFGLLGAATLAMAWLVDVTFTPALCWRWIRADEAGPATR
ncbi:MAG: MMPL family transporter [Deltaproteobacteria bacterium]|nr:MMPL family transporter [Deltaproteobacteria bacterium]